jgi:hypothetical protein
MRAGKRSQQMLDHRDCSLVAIPLFAPRHAGAELGARDDRVVELRICRTRVLPCAGSPSDISQAAGALDQLSPELPVYGRGPFERCAVLTRRMQV